MLSDSGKDKRQYERYEVHYDAEVFDDAGALIERARLQNVSGGGVCLLTSHPGHYTIGKIITVSVCLPRTDRMEACLKGRGKVVWIADAKEGVTPVGVLMIDLFTFEQHDSGSQGSGSQA